MPERIHYLLQQQLAGQLTDGEKAELNTLLADDRHSEQIKNELVELMLAGKPATEPGELQHAAMIASILEADKVREQAIVRRMTGWYKYAVAAVVVFVVCGLWFVVDRRKAAQHSVVVTAAVQDVLPGQNGAVLTLADGRRIVLDSAGNGNIAQQGNTAVVKRGNQLVYEVPVSGLPTPDSRLVYNTISTPGGRQFQLILPDGSKVWLNAASSVRFPTVFTGSERRVAVTGEVYFEVVSLHGKLPFIVEVNGKEEVEVLGTHFNINAYEDEETIKTTLLEGRVKVTATQPDPDSYRETPKPVILNPGQQAISTRSIIQRVNPNLQEVMAWKNGMFQFDNANLTTVMRQLARWYNVEVVFEKGAPVNEVFYGEMQRTLKLSQVLKILESQQVHFRIEAGKRIIVTP